MNIQFLATIAVIAPDPIDSGKFYVEALGLPLQGKGDGYQHSEGIAGCKSFGIWPLRQAAQTCFGTDEWPQGRSVPQVSIEFDVASAGAVAPAAHELEQAGYELLHGPREEPWARPSRGCSRPKAQLSASRTRRHCTAEPFAKRCNWSCR